MEQKFLVYKLENSKCRDEMQSEVNKYIETGWLIKDIKTVPSDSHIYATVIVLIEKSDSSTICIK